MKKLNNKGYLLVEIILASVLTMVMASFLINLTIKAKNKNDDLVVRTLTSTDQGIIYNKLMDYTSDDNFVGNIEIDGKKIIYNDNVILELNEYAEFGSIDKTTYSEKIIIPINVKELPYDNFDVIIYLK